LRWTSDAPGRRFGASPVVDVDGSIYVVGLFSATDHRGGEPHIRNESTLYRFDASGAVVWATPFPSGVPQEWGSGLTTASPNIWRSGNEEAIIVPHLYPTYGGHAVHVVAFSTAGGVLVDHNVTTVRYEITSSVDWESFIPSLNRWFGLTETVLEPQPDELPADATLGTPRVGIYMSGGGEPIVVVADDYENLVGYAFTPWDGFRELFRKHLTLGAIHMSTPLLLGDAHSVIVGHATDDAWLFFGGPSAVNWTELPIPFSGSGPSVGPHGLLVVARAGALTSIATYPGRQVVSETPLEGESITPAAASRTHVFVSTASALTTLDAAGLNVSAEFLWKKGGLSTPAISSDGRVYAIAGDTLFCFAGPPVDWRRGSVGGPELRDRASNE
jgi:outer membrane protein assembly factor BamB